MGIGKSRRYILQTGLGFAGAIVAGLCLFILFRGMLANYSALLKKTHKENIEESYTATLFNMAESVEKQYPVLHDPGQLRLEAGTDWFWETADEWRKIAKLFNCAYIYYITEDGGHFIFLMSSGIQKNEHPEWIGGQAWQGPTPDFVEEAWQTKKFAVSLEPSVTDWGTLISGALPVISNGNVAGILIIDYDISFMNSRLEQEVHLEMQEDAMLQRMRVILLCVIVIIILFSGYQIWLSNTSVMVPIREAEAEQRTRLMLDGTPMISSLWDTEGNILDCNQETLSIFGVSDKKECLARYYDFIPEYQPGGERSRDTIQLYNEEVSKTGYKRFQWMYRTGTGEPLPVEITLVRVPWKKGCRIAWYSRDLREDRAREKALWESEKRLRLMLDTMAIPCFFYDTKGKILDCNQQTVNLFGLKDRQEFLDQFYNLSPKYQSDGQLSNKKIEGIVRHTFGTGEKDIFRWDHIKSDGTALPVEVHAMRVEWEDDYRGIAFLRDLSNLVETQDNLMRALALVEASPNMNIYLGAQGNIEYMSPAVSSLSGYSPEELRKNGLALMFSPEDYERLNDVYIAAALKKLLASFEMTIIAKNGRKHDIIFSVLPVRQHDGTSGVGLNGKDVSDLKRTQRDLEKAKEQAEHALESEIQYNKAKSDFLSRVSHELRTPLNAIVGITSIAEKTHERPDMERGYFRIKEATEHLLGLVNDILDMTGFDTDRFNFSPKPFSFKNMIVSVINNVTQMAQAKEQTFSAEIDRGICDWVESDERRLKQVLMNLLSNAIKFTPTKGSIQLSAKMIEKNDKECTIRFDVIDNGIGISAEMLGRLLQVFEQADNSITREYSGMGLGLPITKRIVDLMHGNLWIESEPGKGSRFACDVHLGVVGETSRVAAQSAAQKAESPGSEKSASGGVVTGSSALVDLTGKRIMVVDDVDINREILFMLLDDTGAILDSAEHGAEAVRLFLKEKYDLILMDLHMPVMDGFTATKNIRASAQPWAVSIPIIAVSAESSGDLHSKCAEAGISDYIEKPVDMETLYAKINQWLPRNGKNNAPGSLSDS